MVPNTIYYINNGASLVTLTLPSTFPVGSVFKIIGGSAGLWKIAQNASQNIQVGAATTTTGVAGFVSSLLPSDGLTIYGIVANTSLANSDAPQGNLTVS
jgi:hypothetical protein